MTSETMMRVCIERCKEQAGPRHTILPLPPNYEVRGERAVLVSGRKRPITAVDETPEASSVSGDSVTTDSSVPPRFRRSRNLGRKDDRGRAERASGDRPAMPATEGGRGMDLHPRIVATSMPRAVITTLYSRLLLQRSSVMPTALMPRVAGHRCLPARGKVGVDLHLCKATTLSLRLIITIMNPHLTDILRWMMIL